MINIFTKHRGEESSYKAINWCQNYHLSYELISPHKITPKIVQKMLSLSANGFDDLLLSKDRGRKTWMNSGLLDLDINDMSTKTLVKVLSKNPQLLKNPIIFNEKKILVGYNEDEIRVFLPRKHRIVVQKMKIENYSSN